MRYKRGVPSLEALLASVLEWAQRDENVLALIVTGSTARTDGRRDEFSDLDVELIARDPRRLLDDDAWFKAFGGVWVAMRFDELDHPTRLVVYEGGFKVDFTVAGVRRLEEMTERLDPLYEGGYRVLVDKAGLASGLPAASGAFRPHATPLQNEFDAVVEEFWFEATHLPGCGTSCGS
ncbi:MAG: aminoglycoside 6-adenylyltransferase [Conexibacter sp.]